ncbi:MAG TPA: TolC family protein [Elusimicrobiota bacterium]|nr:TolC family protein [Elusimicrobiota bacterium]
MKTAAAILGSIFLGSAAQAAKTVLLAETVSAAVETHLTVKLAKADTEAAKARAIEAAASLLPSVIAGASQKRTFEENLAAQGLSGGPVPAMIGPFDTFDARVRLTQTLFDYSLIKRAQAAGRGRDLAARLEEVAREQVAVAAELSYVEAVRAFKAVEAAQADSDLAGRLLEQAHEQERQGTATGVDVVRARARASVAAAALLHAQVGERNALIRLKRVAGWPLGEDVSVTADLAPGSEALLPVDVSIARAQGARPEIAAADEQVRIDALTITATRAERGPSLAANADIGLSGNLPDSSARRTSAIGVGLSIPIFTGRLIGGRVEAAKAEKAGSTARAADIRAQVEEDVRLAYENISEAREQVRADMQSRELADQELRMAEDQYAAGTGDNVAVVAAQSALAQARDAVVDSLAHEADARINLAAALGAAKDFKL